MRKCWSAKLSTSLRGSRSSEMSHTHILYTNPCRFDQVMEMERWSDTKMASWSVRRLALRLPLPNLAAILILGFDCLRVRADFTRAQCRFPDSD